MEVKWGNRGAGYEVSSKGDARFSALFAVMPDGRTIEMHYQCDVKGYQPGGTKWRLGKGKPPIRNVDLWAEYLTLWKEWAKNNPILISNLRSILEQMPNPTLIDSFARSGSSSVNQARALAAILNEQITERDSVGSFFA